MDTSRVINCSGCGQALPFEAKFCFVCGSSQNTERMVSPTALGAEGTAETVRAATGETPIGSGQEGAAPAIPKTRAGPVTPEPTADLPGDGDPLVGTLIADRFRVRAPLGAGGMGSVYLAEQVAVGRAVVLKFLHRRFSTDRDLTERFHREALAASRLSCPNTIVLHDFGQTEDGVLYMAMELLEGRTLAVAVDSAGALAPLRAVGIALQILASLHEAHEKGIVHRDLKPENIMLVERGGTSDFVKVLDFGIAKLVGVEDGVRGAALSSLDGSLPDLTQQGEIFGSPRYMAPEQIQGEAVSPQTDLYAIGAILYLMLTGHTPFDAASTMALFNQHLQAKVPLIRERNPELAVPDALDRLIHRCLSKKPEGRPASAAELADQLRELIPAIARQQEDQERALLELVGIRHRWPRFGRLTWAALAATAALAVALGLLLVMRQGGPGREGEPLAAGERLFVSASAPRVPAWVGKPAAEGAVGSVRAYPQRGQALRLAEGAALAELAGLPERYDPERERTLHLSDLRAAYARGQELTASLGQRLRRESFWAKHVAGLPGGEQTYVYDAFVHLTALDQASQATLRAGFAGLRAKRFEFLLDSAIQRGKCEEARSLAPKVREAIADGDDKKATKDRLLYYLDFKLGRCQPAAPR